MTQRRQNEKSGRRFKIAMRVCLPAIALVGLLGGINPPLQAQTRTTVSDTIHAPDGSLPHGQIIISSPSTFTAADGTVVFQGTVATATVTNGAFSVALVPNAGSSPSGTAYKALYELSGVAYRSETWVVPNSASPVNLAAVRSAVMSGPSAMVAAAQLPATINASAIQDKGGARYDVRAYGFTAGDSTDNTAALNSLLGTVYSAGGGTILFPCGGTYLFNGQIVLPNDGNTNGPKQPPIRITSTCGESQNNNIEVGPGGSTLDLHYSGSYGKIVSQGLGTLEIDHLNIVDNAGDSTPFIYDTNTTLDIHDNIFRGNSAQSATTCSEDAIVLGGTNAGAAITSFDTYFRGFGTHIVGNTFSHIRRAVLANMDANGLVINNNMVDSTSGSNLPDGAAFEFVGTSSLYVAGGIMSGNLIEDSGYTYPVKLTDYVEGWTFLGNDFYDPGPTVSDYDIGTCNVISNSFFLSEGDLNGQVTNGCANGLNNVIQTGSSSYSLAGQTKTGSWFGQPINFSGAGKTNYTAGIGPSYQNSSGDQLDSNFLHSAGFPTLQWLFTPNGGSQADAFDFQYNGTYGKFTLGPGAGWIQSGNGDLRVVANSSGGVVWIGNSSAQPTYFSSWVMHVGTEAAFTGQILQTPVVYASAPACNSSNEGSIQAIKDSTTSAWGATIAGGGTYHVQGYCDGTSWTVAAK